MKQFKRSALVLAMFGGAFALSGCGGSSSSSDGGSTVTNEESPATTTEQTVKTGKFLDSAVEGLRYVTPTKTGLTNVSGEFEYEEGEVVFFLLGNTLIGSSIASGLMTPLDMVNEGSHPDKLSNVLRFLQSLDQDGDPENGITISETARNQAEIAGVEVGFDFSSSDFETQQDLADVLSAENKSLISSVQANDHFEQTIASVTGETVDLKGTWLGQTSFTRGDQTCSTVAKSEIVFGADGLTLSGDELNSQFDETTGVSCSLSPFSETITYAEAPDDLPAKGCEQGVCEFDEVNKSIDDWEQSEWTAETESSAPAGYENQKFSVVNVKYYPGMDKIVRTKTDKQRTRDANGSIVVVNTWGTSTTVYLRKEAAEYRKDMTGTWDVTFSNLTCPDAYSRPRLPLIPDEACHPFHAKAATDSTAKLPPWQAA